MNSLDSITVSGRLQKPFTALIHGGGGVGKTTLAASAPNPFFFDTEKSTDNLSVDRCLPSTFAELMEFMTLFIREKHEYETAVIDTLDWVEKFATVEVNETWNVSAPQLVGYGKGTADLNSKMARVLNGCIAMYQAGYNVIVVAHNEIVSYSNPLGDDYDIFRIKCRDKTSQLFVEWAKIVGYLHRPVVTTEGNGKKMKSVMRRDSVFSCVPNSAYDSKNRYGIGEDISVPLENGWQAIQEKMDLE